MRNSFTSVIDLSVFRQLNYSKITVAAESFSDLKNTENLNIDFFQKVDALDKSRFEGNIFLSSLTMPDKKIDDCIEYVLSNKKKFMVIASRTLEEVGYFDAKYKLSPIMLLYKIGLLENCRIVGGVYLDNDDVDLMVQSKAELILTPTFDSGNGNGIANVVSYISRGLKISLGTGDNSFNKKGDIIYEAEVLRLMANGTMCKSGALSDENFFKLLE